MTRNKKYIKSCDGKLCTVKPVFDICSNGLFFKKKKKINVHLVLKLKYKSII